MEAALQWGETLTFKGIKDAGLPPDVSVVGAEYRGIPLQKSEQAVYQQATNKHLEETLGPVLAAD